ncbi:MAG: monocytochrome c [Phormidesmis priestleyi Ana]|uniref:Monocytochrome c n=1 Tax=Phormidesmis priestleyi Ana TaxID=1666911 RepID=A0A0P8C1Y8_9CYAN|nr:MAG: monocytochrome c [Phormidesmis priestleyi Ana]
MATKSVQEQIVQNQAADTQALSLSENASRRLVQRAWLVVGILFIAVGITFWGTHAMEAKDPYIHSVLELTGDIERGQDLFTLNCATCHGITAGGEVGPDLHDVSERKSRVALIQQVISGKTPPMPQFQPGPKDMADLLSFLETL